MPAKVRDRYKFEYPGQDAKHTAVLTVTGVDGEGPEDFVYFNDWSHSKQRHLPDDMKVTELCLS